MNSEPMLFRLQPGVNEWKEWDYGIRIAECLFDEAILSSTVFIISSIRLDLKKDSAVYKHVPLITLKFGIWNLESIKARSALISLAFSPYLLYL